MNEDKQKDFRNRGRYGWRLHISRILSIWPSKDAVLTFNEIHGKFVELGVVSNSRYKASTARILKKLVKEGYLEKVDKGYRLKVGPRLFTVIDKLKELQLRYGKAHIYEWRVGGIFWTLAEGAILGIPGNIDKNPSFKIILELLLIRLANIFEAIRSLVLAAGLAEKNGRDLSSISPPREAVREFLLNLISHILGERSGIDGDGLPTEMLFKAVESMCYNLPNEIEFQPIEKRLLQEYIVIAQHLYSRSVYLTSVIDLSLFSGDSQAEDLYRKYRDVALIVHPPRNMFDEKGEEERMLYDYLKDCIEKEFSSALLLAHMRHYSEDVIERVLRYLKLQSLLSTEKANELRELYRLARAGMVLDSLIEEYYSLKEEGKLTPERIEAFREQLEIVQRKYGLEEMIIGVWLSDWSQNIYPGFLIFKHTIENDVVKSVTRAITDFFEALNTEPPIKLEKFVKRGYELVKKLDEMLREDADKVFEELRN